MVKIIHTLRNVTFAPLKCAGAAPDILTCAAVISVNVAVTADTKTAIKNGTARSIVFMVSFIDAQHLLLPLATHISIIILKISPFMSSGSFSRS